jgi:hypothetical protein
MTKTRAPGGGRKPSANRKGINVMLWITESERTLWYDQAACLGLSWSEWARGMLNAAANQPFVNRGDSELGKQEMP